MRIEIQSQLNLQTKRNKHIGVKSKAIIVLPLASIVLVGLLYFYTDSFRQSWNYDWTGISNPIKDAVITLEKEPVHSVVNRDSFDEREWLIRTASETELLRLKNYPNASIRAIAYEGLFRSGKSDAFDLLVEALNDKEEFALYTVGEGDKRYYTVGEYLVDEVLLLDLKMNLPPRPNQKKLAVYSFTDKEIKVIDSLYTVSTFRYE